MNEPASREDLEKARDAIIERIGKMDKNVDGMRIQNSTEHGSLYSLLHSCLAGISWIKAAWRRFSILPSDPPIPKRPDKDDIE